MNSFCHLHVHSEYTLLKASSRISDLVSLCKEFQMPALSITDIGNMYGVIEFYNTAIKGGIKPVIGFEAIVTDGSRHIKRYPDLQENHSFLLYAKNFLGYKNLMRLSSLGWVEGFHTLPRIDEEILSQYCEHLVGVIAQKKGKVLSLLQKKRRDLALSYILEKREQFGADSLFLEIVNHGVAGDLELNEEFKRLSLESGVPLLATNDTYYTAKEDAKAHEVLMAIDLKMKRSENPPRFVNHEFYFKTPEQMQELFRGYEEALENTSRLVELCDTKLEFGKLYLPIFPIAQGYDENTWLEHLCKKGMKERYGESPDLSLYQRLEFELKTIAKMGYSSYFLIVSDFIMAAKNKGIPVGPGRGSAAGSIVAYLTGITDICPVRYGLFFERFLNPDRVSMPDIDIDFCFRRREEAIEYVKEKYGAEKVCQIITFGKLKTKAVLKDVARVLDISFEESNEISKAVPEDAKSLKEAIENSMELQKWQNQYGELFEVAIRLEGLCRHTGIHAAGVVIAPDKVMEYVPVAGYGDSVTTQIDGSVLESQGLLKMDFLGLSTLTVIKDAIDHIRKNRSIELDITKISLEDSEVFSLLSKGHTAGVFQVDSALFQGILKQMQPDKFDDIVALVALGRPGPLGMKMDKVYCDCRHDPSKIEYPHPILKDLLQETYGVLIYQEQVMNTAVLLAGYTMAQADELRKVMGKKQVDKLPKHREQFIKGAEKLHNLAKEDSSRIFDLMATFAEYGFNKAHSACYGLICYQTAWLKTHYPQEFMAAAMTDKQNSADSLKVIEYLGEDCKRMNIEILPPDVNVSMFDFSVDGEKIRFSLGGIKEVGEKAIEAIVEARSQGNFLSVRDFCSRVDLFAVNKKVIENLIKVGAFDSMPGNRMQKLKSIENCIREGQEVQKNRKMGQKSLFEAKGIVIAQEDRFEQVDSSRVQELCWEKELCGLYFSGHPLDEVEPILRRCCKEKLREICEISNGSFVLAGGKITAFKRKVNKKGEDWISFRMEDYSGGIDCVMFASQFKRVTFRVEDEQVVFVCGKKSIQEYNQQPQILVEDMEWIDYLHDSERWMFSVGVIVRPELVQKVCTELGRICSKFPGNHQVKLFYRTQGYNVELSLPAKFSISPELSCIMEFDKEFARENVLLFLIPPQSRFSRN